MATERVIHFPRQGEARFWAATGSNYVAMRADDPVTTYTITWPGAAPAGSRFMQIDAAGDVTYATGSSGTLDDAYDSGGAGAGRVITADTGPVEVAGSGGFQITHSTPALLFETTGASNYNFKIDMNGNTLLFERGDQDADISDDVFETIFAIDSVNRRLGLNTLTPSTMLHIDSMTGGCTVTLESDTGEDSSVVFDENGTARWEVGYDQSAGGLVVGRLSFTNPAVFVEDTTGDVGIAEVIPDARFHVTAGASLVGLLEATTGTARLGLRDSATTDENAVGVQAVGDDLQALCGSAVLMHLDGTDTRVGIGQTNPQAKLEVIQAANVLGFHINKTGSAGANASQVTNAGTGNGSFIDQDGNGVGLRVDSEATSMPLLSLEALDTNTRGDITATDTARATDPSAPSDGDLWYNGLSERWLARGSGKSVPFTHVFGPTWRTGVISTIATGVVVASTVKEAMLILAAESGTADDLDTLTLTGSTEFQEGDTLVLRADAGDTITVKHGTGNIDLDGSADKALVNNNMFTLMNIGGSWKQFTPMMVLP